MTTPADLRDVAPRDPGLPERLLLAERDALIPLLRGRPEEDFGRATPCPGWTVRDVVAHCGAVLTRVLESRYEKDVFSPAANDRDIAERADRTVAELIDELERGMTGAGQVIAGAGGLLDAVALGEWIHAGDVREAWGEPGAYGGAGLEYALPLLGQWTRERLKVPVQADLDDVDEPLHLGPRATGAPPARYMGDGATLIRLCAGRPLDGATYELAGVGEAELNVFG